MSLDALDPMASDWYRRRTFRGPFLDLEDLVAAKRGLDLSISVCLPTLDEAPTVGDICRIIRTDLMDRSSLVDELVVIDSGSSDDTVELATAAGARVHTAASIHTEEPTGAGGKGDALWRSLNILTGDIVVWLDADVRNFEAHFVTRLLQPLLIEERVLLAKAFYERPLDAAGGQQGLGGARVTELLVRPFINLLYPELAGLIQPLAGECAGRTDALRELPFFTGYGVEIGLLLDTVARFGLDSVAQVDLGVRFHRNRPTLELGRTAMEVLEVLLIRLEDLGRVKLSDPPRRELVQFLQSRGQLVPRAIQTRIEERPPLSRSR